MVSTVLIVEDDLTFSTMLKTWLGKKGFDVETASTSARARKILLSKEFDLVISDLRLPDQDGINLLSWLREQKKNIPFIIMTGYAEIQSAVQCMKLGATDYISKPIQPDELLKKINTEKGVALLMVTHSAAHAAYASRTVEIEDGRIKD